LLMRKLFGKGTPRGLKGRLQAIASVANASTCLLCVSAMLLRKFGDLTAWGQTTQMLYVAA
jgi:hypothetical protein